MIWLADSDMTYRCAPYRVYWGVRFWSAWIFDTGCVNRKVGDAPSMRAAMALCEADHRKAA